jgi:hypothetical protein
MSVGDPGPYGNEDGDVWVPRTVSYLEARKVAKSWGFYDSDAHGERLTYVGKSTGRLLGFTLDCRCDEVCERMLSCADCDHDHDGLAGCYRSDEGCGCVDFREREDVCRVPAWHFRLVER